MIKIENIEVYGFDAAIRGMRNPLNSWDRSDRGGSKDIDLMHRLYKGGPEHRKYLRQIFVTMDITAPLYWIAEHDTYKVATTRNSCSFMHKGVSRAFEIEDFTTEHEEYLIPIINLLNNLRDAYLKDKDIETFRQIRQILPQGYNCRYTWSCNYETIINIIHQREHHKLSEWREFVKVMKSLPYIKEIMEGEED